MVLEVFLRAIGQEKERGKHRNGKGENKLSLFAKESILHIANGGIATFVSQRDRRIVWFSQEHLIRYRRALRSQGLTSS